MPSLHYSSPPALSYSLSPSGIIALVVLLVFVFGGWGVYVVVVPFAKRRVGERRARVCDAESSTAGHIMYPAEKAKKAAAASVLARARARVPPTLKRSVVMPSPKRLYIVGSRRYLPHLTDSVNVPTRFGTSRTRTRPGPSPLRVAVLVPEPPSKDDAAAYLVKARIRLGVTSKAAALGKSPFGALRRSITTRPHLQSIAVNEVSASFATIRNRVSHGPSPLRAIFTASEPEPEPAPISPTTASDVDEPSIAHALASLLASVYHAEDDDAVRFAFLEDSDADSDSDDPFEFDLGRVVPVPAPVGVAIGLPPLDIPTIIVESPSLTIGDGPKPTSRKRSNSFIGWRQGHSPSKGTGHSGTNGNRSSREKENDGFLRVPSPPHSSRPRPRRPRA
ncbi:hypothetical protein MVEN_02286900 [Mycena venus]|uniref:Transmembrane protein n=1 Tax=Mycena venus TaxID=2733690 RepID=A0A8H7CER6_9AGAR|nr:hypothetical protein MVEN_02286900 [Mycena venus]